MTNVKNSAVSTKAKAVSIKKTGKMVPARKECSKETQPSRYVFRYVTGRMWWLQCIVHEAMNGGVVIHNKSEAQNVYTEIRHEQVIIDTRDAHSHSNILDADGSPIGRTIERNVIKIYFDKRNKEQLDQSVAGNDQNQFVWFSRKRIPDIVITDYGLNGEPNEVAVENPNDFFKYAEYIVKKSYMVKRSWRPNNY